MKLVKACIIYFGVGFSFSGCASSHSMKWVPVKRSEVPIYSVTLSPYSGAWRVEGQICKSNAETLAAVARYSEKAVVIKCTKNDMVSFNSITELASDLKISGECRVFLDQDRGALDSLDFITEFR